MNLFEVECDGIVNGVMTNRFFVCVECESVVEVARLMAKDERFRAVRSIVAMPASVLILANPSDSDQQSQVKA